MFLGSSLVLARKLALTMTKKKIEFLAVSLLSLASVSLLLLRADLFTIDRFEGNIKADHIYYVQLALGGPQSCHEAPYCWRVLQPMLVSLLPLDVQTGFLLMTILSLCLTGVALYYLLRAYGLPTSFSLLGLALFYSLGWATGFLLFYFWLGDGLMFLLIILAIYFTRAGKYWCVMALVALGMAGKELMLAVVPLYYTLNVRSFSLRGLLDVRLAARTALLMLPALSVLWLVRGIIPITNHYDILEWFAHFSSARSEGRVSVPLIIAPGLQDSLIGAFVFGNVATFGLMLVLPFLAPKRNVEHLLRYSPFIILVNAQILVAEGTERLLVYAFPFVLLTSIVGLKSLSDRLAISAWHLLPLALGWASLTLFGRGWMWVFLSWQGAILATYLLLLLVYLALRAHIIGKRRSLPAPA